jgi:hypothetical protein
MSGGRSPERDADRMLDRRTFLRGAGRTGVAAGLVWSAPQVRSLEAQAEPGSAPPGSTTSTSIQGGTIVPPNEPPGGGNTGIPPRISIRGAQEVPPSSGLALTGAELADLALLGGAAVGMGALLRRKAGILRREIEADAERDGIPPSAPPST